MTTTADNAPRDPAALPPWLTLVQQKVEGLRYGIVQLVVHDGRVTQIERTEKTRLSPPSSPEAQS